ncbi:hypothetical protein ACGFJT_35305 [Actinomadura geliboluensis]|uniref:hypothetical protein n=1 Tax=Actinomadura geliboluensis TaxID=882440 RepID=UPI003718EF66
MSDSLRLQGEIYETGWRIARERLARQGIKAGEPADHSFPDEQRRIAALTLLEVYRRLADALQTNIDLAQVHALGAGATYGDIGAACGVSRQAVRQRWQRLRQQRQLREVKLRGGPRDGRTTRVMQRETVRFYDWLPGQDPEFDSPTRYARYVASREDPDIYVFQGIREASHISEDEWHEAPAIRARRPR